MDPQEIGGYRVEGELGAGAAGVAYKAHDPASGERVAIKLLAHSQLGSDIVQKRFVREMGVMEKLDHPNIVKMRECGLHDDRYFYVMEWVDYGTLKDVLVAREAFPWREACECALQISEALAYAHKLGIIHRDLKPGNVFLSSEGKLKLGDFGLARDSGAHSLTADGMTVGTVSYMAPEQITGQRDITGQLDLYALGCMLFEMLTGHPPFLGRGPMEILNHHMQSAPPDVRDIIPVIPPQVSDLVKRLLAKNPAQRPPSAEAVAEELRAILAGSQPAPAEDGAETAPPSNLFQRLTTTPGQKEMNVSWPVLAVLGVVIVGIIVLVVVFNQ